MSAPLRLTVLLYSFALAVSMCFALLLPPAPLEVMEPQRVTIETEKAPLCYVLRTDHGELCIFQGENLIRRTGVAVSSLPAEDRTALENGITATSQQALSSLLEDLCS